MKILIKMKDGKVAKSILVVLIVLIISCQPKKKNNTDELDAEIAQTMDPINRIPEWLQFEIENNLPSEDLNVWVPTGDLQTSSMIRVPRFPVKYTKERFESTPYSLDRFKINLIDETTNLKLSGVKNEQISVQIAIAAKKNVNNLRVDVSDFLSESGGHIAGRNVQIRYVKYVPVQRARSELSWTLKPEEIYGPEVSGFGSPDIVGDPLVEVSEVYVPAFRAQPVWFTVSIPKDAKSGIYKGTISMVSKEFPKKEIPITLEVLDKEIPDAKDYKFFLDLWLNPNAIAVANNIELWSEKHWDLVEKYMDDLVSRGAKTITTTITHDPWKIEWIDNTRHSQTGIGYTPMIQWKLLKDNTWTYDYSIFDKYVTLALNTGLRERIDVFSLTPFEWGGKRYVTYFDEEKGEIIEEDFEPSDEKYEALWIAFLKDFEVHLKSKGWFEKTYLSFDESPKDVIESILKIVKLGAPDFLNRFSIAGKPHTSSLAQSLSIFYLHFTSEFNKEKPVEDLLRERKESDKTTTVYLCGEPAYPNTFTYSPAIESQLIPWLALKMKTDGYLRWAYNSWSDKDPFNNPVFNFIQGDDYYVYPGEDGPVSSIRWELMKEGIEDYELYKILEEQGNVSEEVLQNVIELATRNENGKFKSIYDFIKARQMLLQNENVE
ncbi:glycoside hydrolase domain-containing protein [Seonamhaeicola sp.]|uniref:DUF4091 domain-containing protein n=1 Tax=Seonamhaeicola sp. TaxID=1912245 RepID=UPI00260CF3CD|nr:glycoside hydrolase domain-containing protein [Seonamhaeicola sp.]